ncbi:hypothetical protein OC696_02190, partial [Candidatus Phytoplasma australasiaticum]|nr:hypothetical protein [Candidatus Phytoplasma australasiaticum]
MNNFIKFIEIVLFFWSLYGIFVNFLIPLYFIWFKKYRFYGLRDKNIPTNINHLNKTAYIHLI